MSPDIEHISFPPSCSVSTNEPDIAGKRLYSALTTCSVLTCEQSRFRIKRFAISAFANPGPKFSIAGND